MSHSTVLVVRDINITLEEQLAPFNEELKVPRYVDYTKNQLIEQGKEAIKDTEEGNYAEYIKDPEKYKGGCNSTHFRYISEEFSKHLEWTDEEIYQDQIKYYDKKNIGEDGEIYSNYNPRSKWDWWVIGGRWTGYFKVKKGCKGKVGEPGVFRHEAEQDYYDIIKKGDIDWEGMKKDREEKEWNMATFAVLKDNEWYEQGSMGWFGCVSDEKDYSEWEEEWKKLVMNLSDDTELVVVDVHI